MAGDSEPLDPVDELDRLLKAVREAIDDGLRRVRQQSVIDIERRGQQ